MKVFARIFVLILFGLTSCSFKGTLNGSSATQQQDLDSHGPSGQNQLTVVVADSNQNPLAGASVSVSGDDGSLLPVQVTDSSGTASFENTNPLVHYTATVTLAGYATYNSTNPSVPGVPLKVMLISQNNRVCTVTTTQISLVTAPTNRTERCGSQEGGTVVASGVQGDSGYCDYDMSYSTFKQAISTGSTFSPGADGSCGENAVVVGISGPDGDFPICMKLVTQIILKNSYSVLGTNPYVQANCNSGDVVTGMTQVGGEDPDVTCATPFSIQCN